MTRRSSPPSRVPCPPPPPSGAATWPVASGTGTPSPTGWSSSTLLAGERGACYFTRRRRATTRPEPRGAARRRGRAHADDRAIRPEQVVGVLEHRAVGVLRRARDGQQGSARVGSEDRGLVLARGHDLDVLLRLARHGLVVLLQQVVERLAEWEVQQPGEPLRGEPDVLQGDRRSVGQPDADHVDDVGTRVEHERRRGLLVGQGDRGADDARAGGHPLRSQQRRHTDDARQVALHLLRAHEGATAATRHPSYRACGLESGEGLAHRRAAHAQLGARGRARRPAAHRESAARAGSGPSAGGALVPRPGRSRVGVGSRVGSRCPRERPGTPAAPGPRRPRASGR